jgi:hypothetical protein
MKKAAKKKVNGSSHRIDVDQARLFFEKEGKEYVIDLLPIDDTVVVTLALERLHQLVKNSKDPYVRAEWIRAGRPKKVNAPIAVRAISEAMNKPLGEVLGVWKKMSKDERKKLSEDPVVIRARKQLEMPHDPRPTDLLLDIFG